jgi:predicted phage terminase large subunit-like protein
VSIPLGDLTIDEDLLKQALSTAPLSERARLIALIEELKRRQNREFAQQNFLAFVQQVWPSFIYGRHHARMAQEFEKVVSGENKRLIINLGPRHAVQIDEPIPTPTGWKTMQTLQVGDDVFGQDGKPTKVIGKSEVFHNQQLYRVTTDDGHSLDVDGEHLWTVRMKRGTGVFRDYTTEQLWLRQQGIRIKASRGGGVHTLPGKITGDVRLPMLPQMEGSIYPEKQLLIDPYVLGLWLGDGASAQSHITSHDDDAVFVRKQFEDRGYVTTDQKTKYLFGILGLKVALRELGVLNNKHIPEDYLTASLEQRRDLLKGLMDSDGNVSKKGQCFFAQKSLGFITQVRELLCSLGIKNSMSSTEAKIGDVSYGTHHRLSFYATNICNLPRKEDRTLKTERTFGRYIKVEKLNATGDTQCIKVENEDGLFLAGKGYLCTHNTKSEFGSYLLPAWYLGKNPDKKIIQCSHTAELAVGFGRKVRNLVGSAAYQEIFPGVELQQDSKAAGRWNTSAGGSYFAIGVSGAVTGIGGDIIIIDDPHSEQEAAIAASNPEIYDKVYEWYTSGPRQRLQPGGSVIVIQCMTGDTPVLMHTGTYRFLKDIRPNDIVATYNDGELDVAKVLNWQSNGVDKVWKIRTTSDTIVRANERHPFLVDDNGDRKWIRLKELKVGMSLVKLKGVTGLQDHNLSQGIVPHVKPEIVTIEKIQTHPTTKSDITVNTKEKHALKKVASNLQNVKVCAPHIPIEHTGLLEKTGLQQKLNTLTGLKADTVSPLTTLIECPKSKGESAQSAKNSHHLITQERTGTENYVSTIVTIPEKLEGYFVTTVTSRLGTQKLKKQRWHSQNISEFTVDQIVEISFDGEAEVFDVEIEGTENFIANDLISHNTRWSKRDLTGQVKQKELEGGGDKWKVVELPAILPSGKPLWPEFWSIEELEATRNAIDVSKWQAQYQQNPTSEEGAIVKRDWWQRWEQDTPPPTSFILQAWDTAFEKHNRADYSACTTWGIFNLPDEKGIDRANIILLDAKRDRLEFPQLKEKVLGEYRYWEPDSLIIEKKASGAPLIYELRHMGIVVSDFTPTRGNDKISRLNAISDIFSSGRVWAPNTRWADEVIDEVAAFPAGQHDDYVDCVSMSLALFRKGGYISTKLDREDEEYEYRRKTSNSYY